MNARHVVARAVAMAVFAAAVVRPAAAQLPRGHSVQQLLLDGKPVSSASGGNRNA